MTRLRLVPLLVLTGCTVGPDYKTPDTPLPAHWRGEASSVKPQLAQATAPQQISARWWEAFGDAKLDALVERALKGNPDITIAQARIDEARGSKRISAAPLFPKLSADGKATRSKEGFPASLFPGLSKPFNEYDGNFDASWEIDLFGGTRRQVEAANATIEAREADLADIQLRLIGDVVRNYVELRQLQQLTLLITQTVDAQQKLHKIASQQYEAGSGTGIAATQAQALYETSSADLPEIERQSEDSANRLSMLLGETPGALIDELSESAPLPKPIAGPALDAPAEVIRQRPDVRSAERQLASATAIQGAAIAQLFPKISLSGLFGAQKTSLSDTANVWSFGGALSLPILNFGVIQGGIAQADARQEQAFQTYRKTVLAAVGEVETSLSNVAKGGQRVIALETAVVSDERNAQLASQRFDAGLTNFTEVLDAELQLYTAQQQLLKARAELLSYIVMLYKAAAILPAAPHA
jgi:NodT family efflux transporter outer membrane factor (OMF) lipoprotein